jgi:hypothetical protein
MEIKEKDTVGEPQPTQPKASAGEPSQQQKSQQKKKTTQKIERYEVEPAASGTSLSRSLIHNFTNHQANGRRRSR